jgi:SAM-dependent methyltransferase
MNEYHEINRKGWNRRTEAHCGHPGYRVEEFLNGKETLHPLELEEVGEVHGKRLLHLQCHFGLDTLSWARRGAQVTGVDISDLSITRADELKARVELEARFIRSDIYDLPQVLAEQFDIVFTSYGALWWMSDIRRWAEIAARFVKPGGIFYIAEIHPASQMLDGDKKITEPYFHQQGGPEIYRDETDYCDRSVKIEVEYGWRWSLGDVVSALIQAGLTIEFLHEFPFGVYAAWPTFVRDGDWWYYPDGKKDVPLTFSIRAHK